MPRLPSVISAGGSHSRLRRGPVSAITLFKALFDRTLAIDQATNDLLVACPIGAQAALYPQSRAEGLCL